MIYFFLKFSIEIILKFMRILNFLYCYIIYIIFKINLINFIFRLLLDKLFKIYLYMKIHSFCEYFNSKLFDRWSFLYFRFFL